jgi:hypothetical protein
MTQLLYYVGAYLVVFAISFIVLTFSYVFSIHELGRKWISSKWEETISATFLVIVIPLLSVVFLAYFGVFPPDFSKRPTARTQTEIAAIEKMGRDLIAAFAEPDQLTIEQLRVSIDRVRDYTQQATAINRNQEAEIAKLRQTVEEETNKAREAENLANAVKSITTEQLDAVKFLITKDANEQSKQSFIIGSIISFPIGVVSSLLASFFYERFRRRKDNVVSTT